ncbi:MAG: hypothetical protein IT294_03465 [Deltaproteobacteria bacterium]|nr:hypothetical protein [Deltaproteobacteria bacterium]
MSPCRRVASPRAATPRTAGQALFDAWKRAGARIDGWRSLLTSMGAQ